MKKKTAFKSQIKGVRQFFQAIPLFNGARTFNSELCQTTHGRYVQVTARLLEGSTVFRVVASTAVRSSIIQSVLLQSVSLGSP
jgi:hypothetical protein